MFNDFNKDGDNYITVDEMKQAFKEMKRDLSDKEIQRMVELMDKDNDNKVDFEEFLKYYTEQTVDFDGFLKYNTE